MGFGFPGTGNPHEAPGFWKPETCCGFLFLGNGNPPCTFCEKTAKGYVNISCVKKWIKMNFEMGSRFLVMETLRNGNPDTPSKKPINLHT